MVRGYNDENYKWQYNSTRAPPAQLCFFMMLLLLFLGFSCYINYESMWEDFMDQLKLGLMIFPLLLILIVHWLSTSPQDSRRFFLPLPDQDTIHRAGGSPWGVALLLLFLLFMISYHSSVRHSWWPLLS